MGNCQAVDTASLVIQHPNGKSEKLFWPIPATQIMKTNPGHCVALLITTTTTTTTTTVLGGGGGGAADNETDKFSTVRVTRVKLLRPTDTLTLGHVYRLISTQEVMKGLVAKKQAKMMKMKQSYNTPEKPVKKGAAETKQNKMSKNETQRQRSSTSSSSSALLKSKAWQPSLKSISESHS